MRGARSHTKIAYSRRRVHAAQARHDVQNIDIMNLSGFCRNCLSKWLLAGERKPIASLGAHGVPDCRCYAGSQAVGFAKIDSYEAACEAVYGMPLKVPHLRRSGRDRPIDTSSFTRCVATQDWKTKHQQPATPEQLALFEQNKALHAQTSGVPRVLSTVFP